MDGIVLVDKPISLTSHRVSELIKEILKVKKTGHTGTLDPNVSGLLLVLINKATKLARLFNLDKSYIGVGKLHKQIKLKELRKIAKKFIGKIKQIPPKKSSVKRVEREREIYEFKILEKKGNFFLFKVKCEAGTYIRKLIHDLGTFVGGAHLVELRRIKIGRFDETLAKTLWEIEKEKEKVILPIKKVIYFLPYPSINLPLKLIKKFCFGNFINLNLINKKERKKIKNSFLLIFWKKKLIGVGIKKEKFLKPEIVLGL